MSDIILHHFDASPFAEKVRVALGIKGLAWQSVEIPMVMPKPDLTELTGGYRKTPVMQIGADIYCDTSRIARELEARFDGSALFPNGSEGICHSISQWSDLQMFRPGAGLSLGTNLDLPEEILEDRFSFFDFLDRETLPAQLADMRAQFRANLEVLNRMLIDGRSYLLGDKPSWADAACYSVVWMARGNIQGSAELLDPLQDLCAWEQRMVSFGYGERDSISAEDSHAIAADSLSMVEERIVAGHEPELELHREVIVEPVDYGAVPVQGQLLRLTQEDIAIKREGAKVGEVVVHFPRIGYRLSGA